MKQGEKVYRLLANHNFACEECGRWILLGKPFLLDKIPYGDGDVHNHKICETCWHGTNAVIIDLTHRRHDLSRRSSSQYYNKAQWIAKHQPWRNY